MKEKTAYEKTKIRFLFYKDGFRKALTGNIFLAAGNVLCLIIILLFVLKKPVIQNFATTIDGRIIPLTPLNQPLNDYETIINFAQKVAVGSFNLSFVKFKEELSALRPYFTKKAYTNFLDALQSSGNIGRIKEEQLISSAGIKGAPTILQENIKNGFYRWKVEVPLIVTLHGYKGRRDFDKLVTMWITRVPLTDNPRSIAVEQYIAR